MSILGRGVIYEGYIQGLGDAGWSGNDKAIRGAYLAAMTLRWALLPPGLLLALDQSRHALIEQRRGMPIMRILEHRAKVAYMLLEVVKEMDK